MERTRRSVVRGLALFRWLAWAWMALVLVLARGNLEAPVAAAALVGAALAVTIWLTVLLYRDIAMLVAPAVVAVEVAVALALQLADGFVYQAPHVFTLQQPLGVAWPIAAVLSAGIAMGPAVGAATGVALGFGRTVTALANHEAGVDAWIGPFAPDQLLSLGTHTVMYVLAGSIAGYAVALVRNAEVRLIRAERKVAQLEARDDLARRLHDGVLQTLAVVERRTDDEQLARLARDQERELRDHLFGTGEAVGAGDLGDKLREAAARYETAFSGRTQVLVPDDLPELSVEAIEALAGAVGEALTNAGKHAEPTQVIVYVEPDGDGVYVSVRDDGVGFDPSTVTERVGLAQSIRGRMAAVGGRATVRSSPGKGTEVELRSPSSPFDPS